MFFRNLGLRMQFSHGSVVQEDQTIYRVSQKFVPLISCAITFDQNFIFYMKFLEDVYFSIKYMSSEFQ